MHGLYACRNNCHGSAAASLPAVLPFIMLMPDRLQTAAFYASVLDSIWTGRELATVSADIVAASDTFMVRSQMSTL